MLNETRLTEDEYEKQYYGFSSTELYVNVKERTSRAIKMALAEVETALIKEGGYDESSREQKLTELYSTYMQNAKIPLEKFKTEAMKVFAIPENVVLDEDQYKTDLVSDDEVIKLRKEVAELETELLRQQVFLAACKQQKELIDSKIFAAYEKTNLVLKSVKKLSESLETDENRQRLIDLHKQYVHYYFGDTGDTGDTEKFQQISKQFVRSKDEFFD